MTGLQKMAGCNIQKAEFCILFPGGECYDSWNPQNRRCHPPVSGGLSYARRGLGLAQDGGTKFDDSKVIR